MRVEAINQHGGGLYGYEFVCPGCAAFLKDADAETVKFQGTHVVPTTGPKAWGFNGDVDRPTFTPSILVYETKRSGTDEVYMPRCHSFVRDGRIEFLSDCGHPLAGQTVDLPEVSP